MLSLVSCPNDLGVTDTLPFCISLRHFLLLKYLEAFVFQTLEAVGIFVLLA